MDLTPEAPNAVTTKVTFAFEAQPAARVTPTLETVLEPENWVDEEDESITLADILRELPIAVFSKPECPYCTQAKTLLDRLDVSWVEITLDTAEDRQWLYEQLALEGSARTVPQVFVKGKHIGGYLALVSTFADGGRAALAAQETHQHHDHR